jgi:hypothetical protein
MENDFAHTIHFRIYNTHNELSILNIVFDYNYFFCYFKPTVIKFNKKTINSKNLN